MKEPRSQRLRNLPRALTSPDERAVRDLPANVLRSLAAPLRALELRNAGRTFLLSLAVGTAIGFVACLFVAAVESTERLLLHGLAGYVPLLAKGEASLIHVHRTRQLVPWLLILVPALGGLVTGLIGHFLAPEVLGGGGNAFINAFHQTGTLRRRVLGLKLTATVSTLGTGGSGGREGPAMLIGAATGNLVGRVLRLSDRDRRVLLVAGTAGGLSAVFGTPLGAGLLATEVLYRDDFESDALIAAILSSVTAFSVFRLVFPTETHIFGVAASYEFEPRWLWLYVLLALLVSVGGRLFLVQMHAIRSVFQRLRIPSWLKPSVGGLAVGTLAVCWLTFINPSLGRVHQGIGILGSGYGAAQSAIIAPTWMPEGWRAVALLGGLGVLKMLATALTVESGGSAGDFGPSIAIGGLLGGAFGYAVQHWFPGAPAPGAFALVGMGTFYGGIAHTPLSATIMVCEMAGSYDLLVPLMLSVGLSYLILRRASLYPAQRTSRATAHGGADVLEKITARDIVQKERSPVTVLASARPTDVQAALERSVEGAVVVVDAAGSMLGLVDQNTLALDSLDPELGLVLVAADLCTPVPGVQLTDSLSSLLGSMMEASSRVLPVVDAGGKALWLLTDQEVMAAYYGVVAGRQDSTLGFDSRPPSSRL